MHKSWDIARLMGRTGKLTHANYEGNQVTLDKMDDNQFLLWIEEHSKEAGATFSHYMIARLYKLANRPMPGQNVTEWVTRQQSYIQDLVEDARLILEDK